MNQSTEASGSRERRLPAFLSHPSAARQSRAWFSSTRSRSIPAFGTQWRTQLAPDFEVLVYDCRGHGKSERLPGPYSTRLFADDLASILDDAKWPAASVAGCSMGGCVAQAFAAAYPKRAQALGLIDTTAWYGPTRPGRLESTRRQSRPIGICRHDRLSGDPVVQRSLSEPNIRSGSRPFRESFSPTIWPATKPPAR